MVKIETRRYERPRRVEVPELIEETAARAGEGSCETTP